MVRRCVPCRLLPALLRFAEADAPPECQSQALRFVEFCIHHLENDDPAIHHLAVSRPSACCTYWLQQRHIFRLCIPCWSCQLSSKVFAAVFAC